jgi:hypothetical protein
MMAWTEHGNWCCCCWCWWLMSTKHRPPVTPAMSRRHPTLSSKATHVCQFLPAQSVVQAVSSSRRRFGSRSSTAWKRQQRQHNSGLWATVAALPAVLPVLELWVNTASLPCIQICTDCTSAVNTAAHQQLHRTVCCCCIPTCWGSPKAHARTRRPFSMSSSTCQLKVNSPYCTVPNVAVKPL